VAGRSTLDYDDLPPPKPLAPDRDDETREQQYARKITHMRARLSFLTTVDALLFSSDINHYFSIGRYDWPCSPPAFKLLWYPGKKIVMARLRGRISSQPQHGWKDLARTERYCDYLTSLAASPPTDLAVWREPEMNVGYLVNIVNLVNRTALGPGSA
jgi:hypothetical protein